MNIENIELASQIKKRVDDNRKEIANIEKLLDKFPSGNSGGGEYDRSKIYNLHISEHGDGSGISIDLSGSMIQTEILTKAIVLLINQIDIDLRAIDSL